jgi:hypothetical protein
MRLIPCSDLDDSSLISLLDGLMRSLREGGCKVFIDENNTIPACIIHNISEESRKTEKVEQPFFFFLGSTLYGPYSSKNLQRTSLLDLKKEIKITLVNHLRYLEERWNFGTHLCENCLSDDHIIKFRLLEKFQKCDQGLKIDDQVMVRVGRSR